MGCGGTFSTQRKSSQLKPTKNMSKPTLEEILKIASFEFDNDGKLILTSLTADFIGDHKGDHLGYHKGNHIGHHTGHHHGNHNGNHYGNHHGHHHGNHHGHHVGLHDGYHVGRPN